MAVWLYAYGCASISFPSVIIKLPVDPHLCKPLRCSLRLVIERSPPPSFLIHTDYLPAFNYRPSRVGSPVSLYAGILNKYQEHPSSAPVLSQVLLLCSLPCTWIVPSSLILAVIGLLIFANLAGWETSSRSGEIVTARTPRPLLLPVFSPPSSCSLYILKYYP